MRKIIIGSRGSDLALWQANFTKSQLEKCGADVEIKIIKTTGDQVQHLSFDKIEGKGFFTKELEDALLDKSIDLAVHSYKDLPTTNPPGLIIAGNSKREDPADILVIRKENTDFEQPFNLKKDLIIGTSAARRKAQLLAFRPDLRVGDIRGNVPTRIDKLRRGEFDAIILARAGVKRINIDLGEFEVYIFDATQFIPAPAQGVLAFQIREDDVELKELVYQISDPETADTNEVERKILNLFEGGCHMPVGAYCVKENAEYKVWVSFAEAWSEIPKRLFKTSGTKDGLAENIVSNLRDIHPGKVFITRDLNDGSYFKKTLEALGYLVEGKSLVEFTKTGAGPLPDCDWIFFSSKQGVKYFLEQNKSLKGKKVAALGEGTADYLSENNVKIDYMGSHPDPKVVAQKFGKIAQSSSVLFPQARQSMRSIQQEVQDQVEVIDYIVYENQPKKDVKIPDADILVFTSPLNVKSYLASQKISAQQNIIAIGESTGEALEASGYSAIVSYKPTELALADCVVGC